jgi:nucleotide-binding universal stress UspA family protein
MAAAEGALGNEVLVALDGSEKDQRGLAVALAWARLAGASVHLVRVVRPASSRTVNAAELIGIKPSDVAGRADAEEQLAHIAASLTAESVKPISWDVLEGADVPSVVVRAAEASHVQTVVLGTGGRTGAKLAMLGSVADQVTRQCSKPVIVVPPGAFDLEDKRIEIKRLLVPLDGSTLADRALDLLLALPGVSELDLALLGVVHNEQDITFVGKRLRRARERICGNSGQVTTHVVLHGSAAESITGAIRELLVDMIAMSTRGEGGLRRLVLGSVAQQVVSASEVPVLLLTPTMLADHVAV